jgi:hypothetical protein
MNRLKSIEEHNDTVFATYEPVNSTGVACPKCGNELYYKGNEILTTYPPQRNVKCLSCKYQGTIFV